MSALKDWFRRFTDRFRTKSKPAEVLVGITDPSVARYAAYQEYGWVQQVTPKQHAWFGAHAGWDKAPKPGSVLVLVPRPFMHSTFLAKFRRWEQIVHNAPRVMGITDTEKVLALVGAEAVSDIQMTIKAGGNEIETFEQRHPLTMAIYAQRAQGHRTDGAGGISGAKPLTLTGRMTGSVHFEIERK